MAVAPVDLLTNKTTSGGGYDVGGVLSRSTILSWIRIIEYTARIKFPDLGGL